MTPEEQAVIDAAKAWKHTLLPDMNDDEEERRSKIFVAEAELIGALYALTRKTEKPPVS